MKLQKLSIMTLAVIGSFSAVASTELQKNESDKDLKVSTSEGEGFDFDNIPDPTAPENLLKIGGRGVFLMRQLSDDVLFRDNGSTVEIQFKL